MPRRQLKKLLPSANLVSKMPGMTWLFESIGAGHIWHINRRNISLGVAIGLFVAFWPIPGQMLIAAVFAFVLRANLPTSVALVWITNPVTIVPLFSLAYLLGGYILGVDIKIIEGFTVANIGQDIGVLWVGGLTVGSVLSLFGWVFVRLYWQWQVSSDWQSRGNRRKTKKN